MSVFLQCSEAHHVCDKNQYKEASFWEKVQQCRPIKKKHWNSDYKKNLPTIRYTKYQKIGMPSTQNEA